MTSEYRLLEVDWLKNMWRPDSFFKNAKSVTFQTMTIPNHYMWLYKDKTILYMVKLTLRLSCAMNFMIYPHDTQECKLQMESRRFSEFLVLLAGFTLMLLVSHTTDDMIFQWDPEVPLVVDENIELPQLALVKNYTADCTQVYSTGWLVCLKIDIFLTMVFACRKFHVSGSGVRAEEKAGLLFVSHLYTYLLDRHYVGESSSKMKFRITLNHPTCLWLF